MKTPKNILIIRLSALGDIILTCGAIRDIRQAYPQATIYFLTTKPYAKLLKRNPDIDHVILTERPKLQAFWKSIPTIKQLRSLNLDRVYDLQDKKTRYYRPFLEPIEWVGGGWGASHYIPTEVKRERRGQKNVASKLRIGKVEPEHVFKPDVSWMADPVDDVLEAMNVPSRFVLLIPGSSMKNPDRRWPYYGELAEKLDAAGYPCVTVPGPDELELCSKMPATMLMRKQDDGSEKALTYFELAGVACKAHYAIGNDTGPSHIAARCGAPGLGLFGKATFAEHSGFDTVWSVLQTQDLNTLSVDQVFERAMQDLGRLEA